MKGRSRSGFTPADFNPLYLIDPDDACPVCGAKLRDRPGQVLNACAYGPHDEPAA